MSIYQTKIQLEYVGDKIGFRLIADQDGIAYLKDKYPNSEFVPVHNTTFINVTDTTESLTEFYILLENRDAMIFKISE